jgi:hypothetical protein
MRAANAVAASLLVVFCVVTAVPGLAQTSNAGSHGDDPFRQSLERWSPLATIADLPTVLPAQWLALPSLLDSPAHRVGAAWTAGNPAGLAEEVGNNRSDIWVSRASDQGEYRHPLDAVRRSALALGLGGERTAGTGGVAGRITVHDQRLESSHAVGVNPFTSSPHALSDSAGVDMRQSLVRLEGAGGWSLGSLDMGLSVGYQAWDGRSAADANPRFQRGSVAGFTIGALHPVAALGLRAGLHLRMQTSAETFSRTARTEVVRLVPILGYGEPVPRNFAPVASRPARVEREASALGFSAAGDVGRIGWAAFAERSRSREEQSTGFVNKPPIDIWEASALEVGGAARGSAARRSEWIVDVRWMQLEGSAVRPDFAAEGVLFGATEGRFSSALELRTQVGDGWTIAARAGTARESRKRSDLLAGLDIAVATWSPGIAGELTSRLGSWIDLGLAYGMTRGYPVGSLPNPEQLGPGYQRWIAPELALFATPGTAHNAALTARARTGDRAVWLRVEYGVVAPSAMIRLPAQPEGQRTGWSAAAGIQMP